jgi:hypothetical protein
MKQYFRLDKRVLSSVNSGQWTLEVGQDLYTAEPLLSGLLTGCRWPDNQKSRIIEDDPKRPVNAPRTVC